VLNTGSSVITLLMVFVIQNSQNRDAGAMQAKVDELLRPDREDGAEFIGVEHLTDEQIQIYAQRSSNLVSAQCSGRV
jgi:low affinity Fe/Cu permease